MLLLYENINALVKTSKMEGLSTQVTFMGIVIDTNNMIAGISPECSRQYHSSGRRINVQSTNYFTWLESHPLLARWGVRRLINLIVAQYHVLTTTCDYAQRHT